MNGYGSGSYRSGSSGRSYDQRGDAPRRPRARGRGYGQRDARDGGERHRPARAQECPPELRELFKDARDFVAGLIQVFGLPARLSFGGVAPARDGRQITIDIRGLRQDHGRDYRDRDSDADELGLLIGKHGATLDALSAVTNAVMHKGDNRDLFFAVDVEGYRARRTATLRNVAQRCADRVLREGVALELEPMPPAERRIVHLTLAGHRELVTESTGQGSTRRVVIMPRGRTHRADLPEDDEYLD
ncbi:MAG TPA: R3H domain-containing nucleic acid-binding protein [Candidatus Eremiobacteraceae bacterium]|nr:R3H domain-containing nucleic acid-binding protein [Candidatus Eremiobacteraceae bacterium]